MKLTNVQQQIIESHTRGVKLSHFLIKDGKINYYFENGVVIKSKPITQDRLDWFRLQSGTEPEFLKVVFDILLEIVKK